MNNEKKKKYKNLFPTSGGKFWVVFGVMQKAMHKVSYIYRWKDSIPFCNLPLIQYSAIFILGFIFLKLMWLAHFMPQMKHFSASV